MKRVPNRYIGNVIYEELIYIIESPVDINYAKTAH